MINTYRATSENTVLVHATCDMDGSETSMTFNMNVDTFSQKLREWQDGKLVQNGKMIQDVFPMLNADEREFLMTGITPDKWNAMFGESE